MMKSENLEFVDCFNITFKKVENYYLQSSRVILVAK
jgi:hypothetical protein